MLGSLKGMVITIREAFKKPVTAQYPKEHLPLGPRYMGFPALTWDYELDEPFCTGCMVCVRNCPTQCMKAVMKDNPKQAEGKSHRRKIIDTFEINLGRCILCSICVEVCNFDAIVMSQEHELSTFVRNGNRADLGKLLEQGKKYQADTNWVAPSKKEKPAEKAPGPAEVKV